MKGINENQIDLMKKLLVEKKYSFAVFFVFNSGVIPDDQIIYCVKWDKSENEFDICEMDHHPELSYITSRKSISLSVSYCVNQISFLLSNSPCEMSLYYPNENKNDIHKWCSTLTDNYIVTEEGVIRDYSGRTKTLPWVREEMSKLIISIMS